MVYGKGQGQDKMHVRTVRKVDTFMDNLWDSKRV